MEKIPNNSAWCYPILPPTEDLFPVYGLIDFGNKKYDRKDITSNYTRTAGYTIEIPFPITSKTMVYSNLRRYSYNWDSTPVYLSKRTPIEKYTRYKYDGALIQRPLVEDIVEIPNKHLRSILCWLLEEYRYSFIIRCYLHMIKKYSEVLSASLFKASDVYQNVPVHEGTAALKISLDGFTAVDIVFSDSRHFMNAEGFTYKNFISMGDSSIGAQILSSSSFGSTKVSLFNVPG